MPFCFSPKNAIFKDPDIKFIPFEIQCFVLLALDVTQ
jgi:hypothetical protein